MKILTWNVKVDLPWTWPRWDRRKDLFRKSLEELHPDIFCVQEALKHQVDFFLRLLPSYHYVGVGREDGEEKGEYCACFYNTKKLLTLESDTSKQSQGKTNKAIDWYQKI